MKTIKPKPEEVTAFAQVSRDQVLTDKRMSYRGIVIGTVEDVARQYDIKMKEVDGGIEFKGPKSRLQIFVEKLHFSRVQYW